MIKYIKYYKIQKTRYFNLFFKVFMNIPQDTLTFKESNKVIGKTYSSFGIPGAIYVKSVDTFFKDILIPKCSDPKIKITLSYSMNIGIYKLHLSLASSHLFHKGLEHFCLK